MLWKIFKTFFKVGLFTIGGGYAMLPILQREFMENKWITEEEFMDSLCLTNSLPGPIMVNAATFMGYKLKGVLGAIVAMLGVITPSIVIILGIASVFSNVMDNVYVQYFLAGARPAICALLLYTIVNFSRTAKLLQWQNAALALGAFIAVGFLGVHHIVAIICSAFIGIIALGRKNPEEGGDDDESAC